MRNTTEEMTEQEKRTVFGQVLAEYLEMKACATSPSQRGWKTLKASSGACVGRTWTTCTPSAR
jgi:hypothetical protein